MILSVARQKNCGLLLPKRFLSVINFLNYSLTLHSQSMLREWQSAVSSDDRMTESQRNFILADQELTYGTQAVQSLLCGKTLVLLDRKIAAVYRYMHL